jgi:Fe-S-cluster containining protein
MSGKNLLTIYTLYADWAEEFDYACHKGCATCCTQSVSMTMLEGELIHEYIQTERPELMTILDGLPGGAATPKTTNQFAAACLREEEDGDEPDSWNMAPCVFLRENCCAVYPVRSFMCRSFGSRIPCDLRGEAEVEPLLLTLNTVILQCLEHLDQGRPWGNMNLILRLVKENSSGTSGPRRESVRISAPIPGFLIPPDETAAMHDKLQTLLKIIGRR